ncbi:MAG TPA: LON peptidase substrate-binding domain-containing protein [Solirubrobacteraceae bacterium]|jgi:Lon protease-like protein|nr:LON peptidase substrate-binding domain-containing protein [Solirubrobacteraceae bacterium]
MSGGLATDFPLFPLELVVLPSEVVPLHIFEERYKTMIEECLAHDSEFGIVWLADDGLNEIGCACRIERILEKLEDGRINLLARGTKPFRVVERQRHLAYPAGVIEFVADASEEPDQRLIDEAQDAYSELVRKATDRSPQPDELKIMDAFAMAATVDFGLDAKQGLLNLRSENARLRLVARLFRAALKRLDFVDLAQARAKTNGKVRFG